MLEAQQSQRVQRQCSGKQSAGKFGARPLRDEFVSSTAATAVAFACPERRGYKLARLGLKDSRVGTAPDITYRDAHKSTGRVGRLEEVHFPSQHAKPQRLLSQRLQQISLRARRRRASSLAARKGRTPALPEAAPRPRRIRRASRQKPNRPWASTATSAAPYTATTATTGGPSARRRRKDVVVIMGVTTATSTATSPTPTVEGGAASARSAVNRS